MPDWTLDYLRTAYSDRANVVGHWWITHNDLTTQSCQARRASGNS